ncbi:MAG: diaminopimelate epimerase, partial [Acidobacteriota bacterium]
MTIETPSGVIGAEVSDGGAVTLTLTTPQQFVSDKPVQVGGQLIHGSFILVGVPHYVIFLRDDLWSQEIHGLGRAIRQHPDLQPAGANVNFVVVRDEHSIEVRTYERGVEAETLACGSGVVASVATAALAGRVQSPVAVRTRSGITLEVTFSLSGSDLSDVRLKGDARLVYRATFTGETVDGFDPDFIRDPTSVPACT